MNEQLRNMLGFMVVFAVLGAAGAIFVFKRLKVRPLLPAAFGCAALSSLAGVVVFWFAGLLQLQCAYFVTSFWTIPHAKSATDTPVSRIVTDFGSRWVITDYFANLCGDHDNLTTVRL